ncbi:hypothetical protein TH63_12020 [Rufibacter radiotolerans]|uniref:RagB/SusD family nutrient uptake outer membrane protein n=1 Tax=Rufibacter radiotolerans TaxID=1379910 RepID=A0A0H4VR18_9BACT|nr:RagB/SusD family nutrient uptake outer membrane protein [Rufibacter radiotolerans]AKQ46184.1 hypothetical protein TH63_12020 [Rufibacter radiotolerans]
MKLFRYLTLLLVLPGLLAVQSCSLEEELPSTPTPDAIKTQDDVTAVVNGLYARFNDASAFKFQGFMMLMFMADDMYSSDGSEFGPYGQRTLSGVNTGSLWNQLYLTIGHSNDLIKLMDNMKLDADFEKRVYGEAYFIRAFCYYYLVRLYGGVPLRTEPTGINSDFYLPRSSVDQVYAQIFDDLRKASALLPLSKNIKAAELGRASKGAAQGILSQAYLTYGNQLSLKGQSATEQYSNAVVYADSVINSGQYRLIPNFADLFEVTKETAAYEEVLFGVRFQTDNQNRAQPAAGSEFALRFMAPATVGVTARANTSGAATLKPMHWFVDFYRTGDYAIGTGNSAILDSRDEVSFYTRGKNSNGYKVVMYPDTTITPNESRVANAIVGKYKDPNGKDERNHGNDLFIIRLAEIYLIKAEALNELYGATPEAIMAFNEVRERAQNANGVKRPVPLLLPEDGSATFTKSEFRMKIFHERGLELLAEGQRWFDLVRMQHPSNPTKTMYEYQFLEELPKSTYPKTLPTWLPTQRRWSNKNAVYAPTLNVSVPKFLLFPLPTNELLQNPSIGEKNQNPGW